jgi:hypothetical protein
MIRKGGILDYNREPLPARGSFVNRLLTSICLLYAAGAMLDAERPAFSDDPPAAEGAIVEEPITASDRQHWAFKPRLRPNPPGRRESGWVRTPVDAFILERLHEEGLRPMPEAGRRTLIRRLFVQLTGLPPEPRPVEVFVGDPRVDAYERLVDRLLADPDFGERMGQHWLDLARYADTDGFEHDNIRPESWRYRDWVIQSFREDRPYDEFVRMQIAGDQLAKECSPEARDSCLVATGFALSGPDMPDLNLAEERRHVLLNDVASTVGAVFLGLQMGCAQCHDHKYDPLSQADFYRLRAFFDRARVTEATPLGRVLWEDGKETPKSRLWIRGDFRRPGPAVSPGFPRVVDRKGGDHRSARVDERADRLALADWLTAPDHPLTSRVMANRVWKDLMGVGICPTTSDFGTMGDSPTHPELLDYLASELVDSGWSVKRLIRLIVTSAVFRQASRPFDAEWKQELCIEAGRDWKRNQAHDPDNEWLWHARRRRLDAESIRDSLLAVSGALNHNRGGPGIRPPLPKELEKTLLSKQWEVTPEVSEHTRRSTYLFIRRNLRDPLLDVFDHPDTNLSCPTRAESTTALQALALLNSDLAADASRHLAGRALQAGPPEAAIDRAFQLAFGRPCDAGDLGLFRTFFAEQAARYRSAEPSSVESRQPIPGAADVDRCQAAAFSDACLGILNANEFVYVD